MLLPNRHESSNEYRYGFQGQEKDDEIKGEGNSLNYKYRMHDPRVGRFFAVDPLTSKYPHYSPYQFSGNKVIQFVELEGLEEGLSGAQAASDYNGSLVGQSTPNSSSRYPERNVVNLVDKMSFSWEYNTKGDVHSFLNGFTRYTWDDASDKKWYYSGNGVPYNEGSYSDGFSGNYSPSWAGAGKAKLNFEAMIWDYTGSSGPEHMMDDISDAWNNLDAFGYLYMTSFQKGAFDGGSATGIVNGLPVMAASYVFTAGGASMLSSFGLTSTIPFGAQVGLSNTFGISSKMFGAGGEFGGVGFTKGLLNGIATPYVRLGWQMTSGKTMRFGLRLGANPNWLINNGVQMSTFKFNLNYSIYNSFGHSDILKFKF